MTMVKTKRELQLIKKSATISNSCIKIIKKSLREKNITEKEIARRIRTNVNKQGATLSFQTLVASGPRSAMVHPRPHATNQKINGMGYVDFGARYKGYITDVTVPFAKGKIGPREKRIIKTGLNAYRISLRSVRVGQSCWKLHEKIDEYLRKNSYKIPHSLGHGIGKKVHERPIIGMPRNEKKLKGKKLKKWLRIKKINFQPNMVFTIEPGIYVKNLGGFRIENDVLLTSRGIKILTQSKLIKV